MTQPLTPDTILVIDPLAQVEIASRGVNDLRGQVAAIRLEIAQNMPLLVTPDDLRAYANRLQLALDSLDQATRDLHAWRGAARLAGCDVVTINVRDHTVVA